jgi:hypothetical protein
MTLLYQHQKECLVHVVELEAAEKLDDDKKSKPKFHAECRKQLEAMNRI